MAYPAPNGSIIGLDGLMNYTKLALETQQPGIGASAIGLALIIPIWFVIFLPMSLISPIGAFTVASFIAWVLSIFLIAAQLLNPLAFGVFFTMWIAGAIAFYLQTRS